MVCVRKEDKNTIWLYYANFLHTQRLESGSWCVLGTGNRNQHAPRSPPLAWHAKILTWFEWFTVKTRPNGHETHKSGPRCQTRSQKCHKSVIWHNPVNFLNQKLWKRFITTVFPYLRKKTVGVDTTPIAREGSTFVVCLKPTYTYLFSTSFNIYRF